MKKSKAVRSAVCKVRMASTSLKEIYGVAYNNNKHQFLDFEINYFFDFISVFFNTIYKNKKTQFNLFNFL